MLMKDLQSTFTALKASLDDNRADAAAMNAAKLETLFKEVEDFWVPFKTRDALEFAKGAQISAAEVAAALRAGNAGKAQTAYGSIGKFCKGCHDSHRELMPDKTYRIKP